MCSEQWSGVYSLVWQHTVQVLSFPCVCHILYISQVALWQMYVGSNPPQLLMPNFSMIDSFCRLDCSWLMLIFHVFQEMTVKMPSGTQEFHKLLLFIYGSISWHILCCQFNTVTNRHLYSLEQNNKVIIHFNNRLNYDLNIIFIFHQCVGLLPVCQCGWHLRQVEFFCKWVLITKQV